MLDSRCKTVQVELMTEQDEVDWTPDDLLVRLHRVVSMARRAHPELACYSLFDVGLRLERGTLVAKLEFRLVNDAISRR